MTIAVAAALALAPAAVTVARAAQWRDADTLIAALVRKDPDSARVRQAAAQRAFVRGAFSDAYEHLRRAAVIEPGRAAPLVGMLRIAATVHGAIEAGELTVDAPPVALPGRFDAPLEPHADYLAVLTDLLDADLARRLASGPLAAGDRAALAQFRVCVQAGAADCR
ncbi:MAG: hypothetical protein KDC48_24660, partial [Planctomycetes bacterium]|nr:hypothetical protein [Planctomycetota bacterium]